MHNRKIEILPLTGLRFVAALYVFLFHVHLMTPLAHGWVGNLLGHGAAGMSLFFILSGFILSYQYAERPISVTDYALNRFARIYPVYAVAALITVPVLLMQMNGEGWPGAKFLGLIAATFTGSQAWIPSYFYYWNHGASWSISAEYFFYALFPLLLPIIWRARSKRLLLGWIYMLTLVPGALYFIIGHRLSYPVPALYASPIFRLPEFCFGMALYRVGIDWNGRGADLLVASALAVLTTFLIVTPRSEIHVTANWIVVPCLGAVVLGTSKGVGQFARAMSTKRLVGLGKASYCFYSFQAFVLFSASGIEKRLPHVPVLLSATIILLVLTALSSSAYRWIEEPARRYVKARAENLPGLLRHVTSVVSIPEALAEPRPASGSTTWAQNPGTAREGKPD